MSFQPSTEAANGEGVNFDRAAFEEMVRDTRAVERRFQSNKKAPTDYAQRKTSGAQNITNMPCSWSASRSGLKKVDIEDVRTYLIKWINHPKQRATLILSRLRTTVVARAEHKVENLPLLKYSKYLSSPPCC